MLISYSEVLNFPLNIALHVSFGYLDYNRGALTAMTDSFDVSVFNNNAYFTLYCAIAAIVRTFGPIKIQYNEKKKCYFLYSAITSEPFVPPNPKEFLIATLLVVFSVGHGLD